MVVERLLEDGQVVPQGVTVVEQPLVMVNGYCTTL